MRFRDNIEGFYIIQNNNEKIVVHFDCHFDSTDNSP